MRYTSLSLLSFLVSTTLQAQSDKPSDGQDLERMIVTGSRIVESIDEVPASIVIITQQQIQDQLKVTSELQSLLSTLVPGLAPSTGTSSNSGQTLRGRAPLIMIDGVPQSTPLRNGSLGVRSLDASTIERIEVIKGATSVYGNGAAGGIINYITKKADSNSPMAGHVTVSSRFSGVKFDDTLGGRLDAGINGKLDKFSYVLNASYEENGVQRDAQGVWIAGPPVARRSRIDAVVNVARGASADAAEDVLPAQTVRALQLTAIRCAQALADHPDGADLLELGVDAMIDPELNPWVIELNTRPWGRLSALYANDPERWRQAHVDLCARPFRYLAGRRTHIR